MQGLVFLLGREDWNASEDELLRPMVHGYLADPDPLCRYFAAPALHLIERDPAQAIGLMRARLREETDFEVGATLVAQLERFVTTHPELLDEVVYDAAFEPWLQPFEAVNSQANHTFVRGFVHLVLRLALVNRTPNARSLAQSWFEEPFESKVCDRATILIRRFLTEGETEVRSGAFELLMFALGTAERVQTSADPRSTEFRKAFEVVSRVCRTIHLASGAVQGKHGQDSPPPPGYLESALSLFHKASAFRAPPIVHDIVQTLAHLASQDPAKTLRCLRGVVDRGDPYSYDSLAQEATTALCARYLSEFWENIADDDTLLTALREVLTVFVIVGHPPAIDLSRRLGEAFR